MMTTDKPSLPVCPNCGAEMGEITEYHGVMVHGSYACVACDITALPSELAWMCSEVNPFRADAEVTDEVIRYRECGKALVVSVLHADRARLVLGEAALEQLKQTFAPCDLDRLLFYLTQAHILDRENMLVPVPPNRAQRRAGVQTTPAVVLAVVLTPGSLTREEFPALPVFAARLAGEA